jgi:hypothetical protein
LEVWVSGFEHESVWDLLCDEERGIVKATGVCELGVGAISLPGVASVYLRRRHNLPLCVPILCLVFMP